MLIARRPAVVSPAMARQADGHPKMRLVPTVRATAREGSGVIPWLPLLPPSTASERLYPLEKKRAVAGARLPDVSGEGNPVLDAVHNMLREHAPGLLESYWTVEVETPGPGGEAGRTAKRQVPARLANVLNLQSMTMMMDLLLGTGLVLHSIRSLPGYNERVQLVMQARRDPHNLGYAYLESVEGNNVRYSVGLDINNSTWSRTRSGGLGTAASQAGEPASHNPSVGSSGSAGAEGPDRGWIPGRLTQKGPLTSSPPGAATSRRWMPSGTRCSPPAGPTATAGT
jgi:hypothetical protein